ncbi:hypothetical protein GA0061071_11927 [Kosakonia oryzendophytica]|uniref:Uncharacterized protein n=1 Tax=Kosakonia oryzendophytica TaxID=1005665 RepID=A0A1C4E8R1_9ENTR|nr:hypothetical protein DFO53_3904 [Enterobacter sp. AG5470]SCC39911.1 hypothetical protein GA0061071_11927 [Kosakonia oryzendophytica]
MQAFFVCTTQKEANKLKNNGLKVSLPHFGRLINLGRVKLSE